MAHVRLLARVGAHVAGQLGRPHEAPPTQVTGSVPAPQRPAACQLRKHLGRETDTCCNGAGYGGGNHDCLSAWGCSGPLL